MLRRAHSFINEINEINEKREYNDKSMERDEEMKVRL